MPNIIFFDFFVLKKNFFFGKQFQQGITICFIAYSGQKEQFVLPGARKSKICAPAQIGPEYARKKWFFPPKIWTVIFFSLYIQWSRGLFKNSHAKSSVVDPALSRYPFPWLFPEAAAAYTRASRFINPRNMRMFRLVQDWVVRKRVEDVVVSRCK